MADNSDNFYYMDVEINPSDKIPLSYLKDGMKNRCYYKITANEPY